MNEQQQKLFNVVCDIKSSATNQSCFSPRDETLEKMDKTENSLSRENRYQMLRNLIKSMNNQVYGKVHILICTDFIV